MFKLLDCHSTLGPDGREAYNRMYWKPLGDMLLPFLYAPLLMLCTQRKLPKAMQRSPILVLPFIAGIFDIIENLCITQLIAGYSEVGWDTHDADSSVAKAVALGPWASGGKWIFLAATLFFLAKASFFKKHLAKPDEDGDDENATQDKDSHTKAE